MILPSGTPTGFNVDLVSDDALLLACSELFDVYAGEIVGTGILVIGLGSI